VRIAILVPLFPPKRLGGTEIAAYNIAKHLATRSHHVHVITSLDKGLSKESIEDGFHIHRVSRQKVKFLGIISYWLKVFWLLKKINPDIVHTQSIGAGIPGVLAKKILKRPYVVWGRGSEIYLPWRFKEVISKLVLRNADAVIALTEDMKREIRKICDKDIYVIPNGVDLERFENLSRENIRRKLEITNEQKIVIFAGTLRPIKGVKYLIQAMNIIRQKNTKASLMLIGDGEERQSLEELVKESNLGDCVTFVGQVPNEEVLEYMAASDVFVLPSLSEGFPLVILEAMASGLPIVATKVGGLPEIIKEGDNGFLVEPKDSVEITEKVLLLLQGKELRQRIAKNNRQRAKDYAWAKVVDSVEQVYQKVVAAL